MKKIKRILALMLIFAMMLSIALQLVACGDDPQDSSGEGGGTECTAHTDSDKNGKCDSCGAEVPLDATKSTYTVEVKNVGGTKLAGVYVNVVDTANNNQLVDYGKTDENGIITFNLTTSSTYAAVIADCPAGYEYSDKYPFGPTGVSITLVSKVLPDTGLNGVTYKLGDIMHDFTVTDSDGKTHTLSKLLETKKAVVLNFWYTTCSWCIQEFPDMNAAYANYKDDIEILALNAYQSDRIADIEDFKATYALDFPMAKDVGLQDAFGFTANPCTVVIDRYGMIVAVEIGAVIGERYFNNAFEHFTSDNYKQELYESIKVLSPTQKPTASMPSSAEISAVFDKGGIPGIKYLPAKGNDAEYSWPFIIDTYKSEACIRPSNKGVDASYAILRAEVTMKVGDALVFDFFSSTQVGYDVLYVLVDGKDIYSISGVEDKGWQTCCTYVAKEAGTYEVSFCYQKDEGDAEGDDTVYLKNLRIIDESEVNTPSYIFRYAATKPTADQTGYENYVTVVLNEEDGYYHVGTKDGPLLLADLLGYTRFDGDKIVTERLYEAGVFNVGGVDKFAEFEQYCNYASNSSLYGYCTVTEDLRAYLEAYTDIYSLQLGKEKTANNWLQLCLYYDAYGTDGEQFEDPIKGLATFSAFEAKLGTDNEVSYNRVIMPRGYFYKFVPETSGVYRVTSDSANEVDGWIFKTVNERGERVLLSESATGERYCEELLIPDGKGGLMRDLTNCTMVAYMEAGKAYYIAVAFYDVYCFDSFSFEIKYVAEEFNYFREASPGPFTFDETINGGLGDTIAGGIDVILGEDGYYHHKMADGSEGSIIYADFHYTTNIFPSHTMQQLIDNGAFDFRKTQVDQDAVAYYNRFAKDVLKETWGTQFEAKWSEYLAGALTLDAQTKAKCDSYVESSLRTYWGTSFDEEWKNHNMDDILAGIYHGGGENKTEFMKSYIAKMENDIENNPERQGCVAVDAELGAVLQMLMDKFTFKDVDHSWTKLCYYYEYMGPSKN